MTSVDEHAKVAEKIAGRALRVIDNAEARAGDFDEALRHAAALAAVAQVYATLSITPPMTIL